MTGLPKTDRMEWWPRASVRPNPHNVRRHSPDQLKLLADGMRKQWTMPCLVVEDEGEYQRGMIVAGHGRFEAAPIAGYHDQVKVLVAENWSPEMVAQYAIFDNVVASKSTYDDAELQAELLRIVTDFGASPLDLGMTQDELDAILNPQPERRGVKGSLAEAFGVPPFSVLIARDGWWQNRKKLWLALGIQSELGRADHVEGNKSHKGAPKGAGRLYGGRRRDGSFGQQVSYRKPK